MTNSEGENDDNTLMRELRIKDEKLTKEMYETVLDPTEMLNVLLKKLKLSNETEVTSSGPRCKLIVDFMKVAVENRMLITQREMDGLLSLPNNRRERSQTKSDKAVSNN